MDLATRMSIPPFTPRKIRTPLSSRQSLKEDTLEQAVLRARRGDRRANERCVVDENGERVAVLLDIEDYERMVARHPAPAEDEPPNDEDEALDPEEAERRITEFVTNADDLPGPPVTELAEDVAKLMRAAWRDVETIVNGNPHNKVLAVELFLGQQARGLQPDNPEQWRLHAAVSLLSGIHLGKAGK